MRPLFIRNKNSTGGADEKSHCIMAQLTGAGGGMAEERGHDMEVCVDFSLLNLCSRCSGESSSTCREGKERKREGFLAIRR